MKIAFILVGIVLLIIITQMTNCKSNRNSTANTQPDEMITQPETSIVYKVVEKLIDKQLVYLKKEDLDEECEKKKNYDTETINYLKEHGYDRCLTSESIRIYLGGPAWEIVHCFPCKSGGYCVLYLLYDGFDTERVNFYHYKDDKIENYDKCPEPSLCDYFANADKFPSDVFNYFSQIITEKKYIYNFIGNKLEVSIPIPTYEYHYERGEYDVPAPLKKYYDAKRCRDSKWGEYEHPMVPYIWNGEVFVLDPDYKPYKEDLSLFE